MPTTNRARHRRRYHLAAIAGVVVGLVALSACSSADSNGSQPSGSADASDDEATNDVAEAASNTLTIRFDDAGLKSLYESGDEIAIAREMTTSAQGAVPVIWAAFRPLEENTITWDSTAIDVISSLSGLERGEVIEPTTQTAATNGDTYDYANGAFTRSDGGDPSAVTVAVDADASGTAVGLSASLSVNKRSSTAPFGAVPAPPSTTVTLESTERVHVFATSFGEKGTVLAEIPSGALALDMAGTSTAEATYTDGRFEVASNS